MDPKPTKPAGSSASSGSGKSKVTSASGSGKIAAPASGSGKMAAAPAASPAETPAAAAPVVNPKAGFYGLIALVIGGTMLALFFLPWLDLKHPSGEKGSYFRSTGLNLMLQKLDESSENAKSFIAKMQDRDELLIKFSIPADGIKPDEILRARQIDAAYVPILLYVYVGVIGLTTLIGLLNAGKVAPPALGGRLFGAVMTVAGIVAMAVVVLTLFVENKLPSELGNVTTAFKYFWQPYGVIGAGLGFCLFGLGVVYFLTGAAPSGGKGRSKPRPRIGGSAGPVTFEPPV